ncbi:class I SAM-dependent methyltransferase [Actinacidiphila soli]|uniref:class I SAM-dependent methyltransferase n=1 Tax=Actinacidiphila soli TaxID=2487275 RepID=UPI0013E2C3B5|nr:class I SAM-dependent methyltransferase [Actinacidiphila soli]
MPEQSRTAAAVWSDPSFASAWLAADPQGAQDLLELPRLIAARLVADETPSPGLVVDVASGAGKFLSVFLDAFPGARGVWLDASDTMLGQAKRDLARFGDRVDFLIGDMGALRAAGVPEGAAALITSRASHHLGREELHGFYREAAGQLAPGGWLVNLDHIGLDERWNRRFRSVRKQFSPPRTTASTHHHAAPLPKADDHLDGFRAAGVQDVDIAWKAFYSCLFIGRTPLA